MTPTQNVKLTQSLVQRLHAAETTYDSHDSDVAGLVVRVRPTGVKTYLVRLRDTTRRHPKTGRTVWYWETLGSADVLTPEHARRLAKGRIGRVADGKDPREARKVERAKAHRSLTLAQFLDADYEAWATTHLQTGEATVARLRARFVDLLPMRLDELSNFPVETWRSKRLKAGTKPATVNRELGSLKAALSRAVEWRRLDRHPLLTVKPAKVDTRGQVRFLSPAEEARLMAALDARDVTRKDARETANQWRADRSYDLLPAFRTYTDILAPLVRTALNTGLRFGELCNLRWADVTLTKAALLTVRGSGAKSGQTRHVPLNDGARDILKAWRTADVDPDAYIFPGRDGARLTDIKTAWAKLLKDANVTKFRFHDTRHTFASKLVQAGVDLNTVRELLGHADIKMTLRYAHLAPEQKREAVAKLVVAS